MITRRKLLEHTAESLLLGAASQSILKAAPQPPSPQVTQHPSLRASIVGAKALVFDVFGTVVDWRSPLIRELERFARRKGVSIDAASLVEKWRAGGRPAMDRINNGETPWMTLEQIYRARLEEILPEFNLATLSKEEKDSLNRAWHRLDPWPDSVKGLLAMKKKVIIAPLSNGNISFMTKVAKHAGLPWDCILGAELVQAYKRSPAVYRSAARILDISNDEVVMVAAHLPDLRAAKKEGLQTAFVPRPLDHLPGIEADHEPDASVDVTARNLVELADRIR